MVKRQLGGRPNCRSCRFDPLPTPWWPPASHWWPPGLVRRHHLGDFWYRFGHRWAPRGSQNLAFWHQETSKVGNMTSQNGCRKKLELLMEFWSENGGLGGAKSLIFHCFFNRIVLSAFFEKAWKFDRKWLPKCSQNPSKIWLLALEDRIFAILG